MKVIFGFVLFCSLFSFSSYASDEDFVSKELFYEEALRNYPSPVDLSTLQISPVSKAEEELDHYEVFFLRAQYKNPIEGDMEFDRISFKTKKGIQFSCFGSILPLSKKLHESKVMEQYRDRSGTVFIAECDMEAQGAKTDKFRFFDYTYHQVFPLIKSLPITNTGDTLADYKLLSKLGKAPKSIQCVSKDRNRHNEPRSAVILYDMGDHYSLGMSMGSSTPNPEEDDVVVDAGPQDLGSLDWYKKNIEFFRDLRGGAASAFNIIFPKDNCKVQGLNSGFISVRCQMKLADSPRTRHIEAVSFTFLTTAQLSPLPDYDQDKAPKMIPSLQYKIQLGIRLYQKVNENPFRRMDLNYENLGGRRTECLSGKALQPPKKPKRPRKGEQEA